jgi:hypothetical protein
MTLQEVAIQAIEMHAAYAEAEHYDHGFDAGEFSHAANGRAVDQAVADLAERHGFTLSEVEAEMHRLICGEEASSDNLRNYE